MASKGPQTRQNSRFGICGEHCGLRGSVEASARQLAWGLRSAFGRSGADRAIAGGPGVVKEESPRAKRKSQAPLELR